MASALTESQEDYLETIFRFVQKEGHAHVRDIAERLGVRMASVSGALRSLKASGLVNYQRYGTVTLTEQGTTVAARVSERHDLLERFMQLVLGVDSETAADNACRMEHAMTEDVLERLTAYVAFVEKCPVQACTWQAREKGFCGKADACEGHGVCPSGK